MNDQEHLLQKLTAYSSSDYYPFHMPGHKRAPLDFPNPWSIDITEIEGFDNLHHATGILDRLQQEAAALFGARKSFCLINGSTCGLLAAVSACVKPGGKLLLSRNCHKSVYHAIYLRNITPVYMMPELTGFGIMGSLSPSVVEQALQNQPDIDAVLVVSPTYDGVVSDIQRIADIVHAHNLPLIVDEAHGAHFPLSRQFPESALSCGADVVIHSLHKTLPAFTQTALLHLNSHRVDEAVLRRFLGIYQSSSPSYLLMASMDQCMEIIRKNGTRLFEALGENLNTFYEKCTSLRQIRVYREPEKNLPVLFDRDESKILISAAGLGLSGQELYELLLERYHLQLEMASGHYALALTSLMDRPQGLERLSAALTQLDQETSPDTGDGKRSDRTRIPDSRDFYQIPRQKMTIAEAFDAPSVSVPLEQAAGKISREFLYLYPPGIPLVAPGEIIEASLLEKIGWIKQTGLNLEGLSDMTNNRINIVNF